MPAGPSSAVWRAAPAPGHGGLSPAAACPGGLREELQHQVVIFGTEAQEGAGCLRDQDFAREAARDGLGNTYHRPSG